MPAAVPLTLLSGFLGAGKTTLLKQILNNKEGIKCAVVVNDLAAVNVDARLVGTECKGDDHLVHLENGCICCDLNEAFVEQVVTLAQSGKFEYIIVENTGVADPEPVAESLVDPEISVGDAQKLSSLVALDTCVTVVDASMFFKHLHNRKRLKDTELAEKGDAEEAENLICQLLANQIEYADVVALNKTDLVPKSKLKDIRRAVQSLNPNAKVIACTYGQVEWRRLLGTGSFSKDTTPAHQLPAGSGPRDSNFEDAVSSFVYTSRMPFHPARLHAFITKHFHLHQRDWSAEMQQNETDAIAAIHHAAETMSEACAALRKNADVRRAAEVAYKAALAAAAVSDTAVTIEPAEPKTLVADRTKATKKQPFGRLLRSKGVVWLAGDARHHHCGDWSHAGEVLQFTSGGPWMVSMPLKYWPEDEAKRAEILANFAPGTGDRRQELVFIGMELKESVIREELDKCLCTHPELLESDGDVPDPFAPWPAIEEMLPDTEEESEEESGEEEEEEGGGKEEDKGKSGEGVDVSGEDEEESDVEPGAKEVAVQEVKAQVSALAVEDGSEDDEGVPVQHNQRDNGKAQVQRQERALRKRKAKTVSAPAEQNKTTKRTTRRQKQ